MQASASFNTHPADVLAEETVYTAGDATLYCRDAIAMLNSLPAGSIDLMVTDPPYRTISGGKNGGKNGNHKSGYPASVLSKNDGLIFANNDIKAADWFPAAYRALRANSHFYCMTNVLNLSDFLNVGKEAGFKLHNVLLWEKRSCNANRWYMKHIEFTLFFYKGAAFPITNMSSKQLVEYPNPKNKKHPTEKPVELMSHYIANSSRIGELVCDPFSGCGTTLAAALSLGRKFVGSEIDREYFDLCKSRAPSSPVQAPSPCLYRPTLDL